MQTNGVTFWMQGWVEPRFIDEELDNKIISNVSRTSTGYPIFFLYNFVLQLGKLQLFFCSARYHTIGSWYGFSEPHPLSTWKPWNYARFHLQTHLFCSLQPWSFNSEMILDPLQARILKHTVLCMLVQKKYSEINHQNIIWKWLKHDKIMKMIIKSRLMF